MASPATGLPALLKSRTRHTWWLALPLAAMLLFVEPMSQVTAWVPFWVHENVDWIGYVCLIICVLGRTVCSAYVGGRKNEEVAELGPYSVVRNPLYVFSFIGVVGIGLVSAMVTVLVVLVGLFLLYYSMVVAREEAYLTAKFGEGYRAYRARVPRWIPNPALWKSPETIEIMPRYMLETMRDSAVFFVAYPVLELIEYLHNAHFLPVLFYLP